MSTTLLPHLFLYSASPSSFGVHNSGSSSLISTNSPALIFLTSFEGTRGRPSPIYTPSVDELAWSPRAKGESPGAEGESTACVSSVVRSLPCTGWSEPVGAAKCNGTLRMSFPGGSLSPVLPVATRY